MKVGRVVRVLTHDKRKELLNDKDENRKIVISIFYPADESYNSDKKALYLDLFSPCEEEFIKRFAGRKSISGQVASEKYLSGIRTNTYNNIPIRKEEKIYPVLIYSPGLGMDRDSSIYNIEKLVDEGYIVFTIGHLYDADFTILPDGKIIEQVKQIESFNIEEKQQLVNIRKDDILFLLDELKKLNKEDKVIKEKLDIDKVGIMGHSLGGAAVFRAAMEDTRIKAIVLLDASLQLFDLKKYNSLDKKVYTPVLNFRRGFIEYSEEMKKTIENNAEKLNGEEFKKRIIMRHQVLMGQLEGQIQLYESLAGYRSFIKLIDSEHLTFTDWPVIFNQKLENGVLPIDEAHDAISEATVRFFNEFLCGIEDNYSDFINNDSCPRICRINKFREKS